MQAYSIYFSPTGGTKKVADILSASMNHVKKVDITVNAQAVSFSAADCCIFSVPSFGGRVPAPAVERIRQLQGNDAKVVAVVVYGNRAIDDTLLELKDELEQAGFVVVAGISAVAEHSIMRQFGANRPDQKDAEELQAFMKQINWNSSGVQVPGNKPYRAYDGVPMKPTANRSCKECRLCARECPVNAIHGRETDKSACISCMRCVSLCPVNARKVSPLLLTVGGLKMKKTCSGRKENNLYL